MPASFADGVSCTRPYPATDCPIATSYFSLQFGGLADQIELGNVASELHSRYRWTAKVWGPQPVPIQLRNLTETTSGE